MYEKKYQLFLLNSLLSENTDVIDHLVQQSCLLKEKTKYFQEANINLDAVIKSVNGYESSQPHLLWGVILKTADIGLT